MKQGIVVLFAALCAWPLSTAGQVDPPDSPSTTSSSHSTPLSSGKTFKDSGHGPTAEELLEALQRRRPVNEPVLPVGASERAYRVEPRNLLPEGYAIVSRSGHVAWNGEWWTFVFDSTDGEPPAKLLPNAGLEVMVRTAAGASAPIRFVISGELTVFEGENYLLVRLVRRSVETTEQPITTGDPGDSPPENANAAGLASNPVDVEPLSDVSPVVTSVEDVLAAMKQQEPAEEIIPPPTASQPTAPPSRKNLAAIAALNLLPDGSPLVRRPGRILRDESWWTFVFDSDHPDHPEPPMKLLPSQGVEKMLRAFQREKRGVVFLVSGEATVFQGENYLLPRMATLQRGSGNLRK